MGDRLEHNENLQAPRQEQVCGASRESWENLKLASTGKMKASDDQTLDFSKNDPFDALNQSARVERLKSVQSNYPRDLAGHIKSGDTIAQPPTDPPYTEGRGWLTTAWRPTQGWNLNDWNPFAVLSMAKYAEQSAKEHQIPPELRDPYRHALMSAYEQKKYGNFVSHALGDVREWGEEKATQLFGWMTSTPAKIAKDLAENELDFHNNRVGRRLGSWSGHNGLSEKQIEDLLTERVRRTGTDRKIPLD